MVQGRKRIEEKKLNNVTLKEILVLKCLRLTSYKDDSQQGRKIYQVEI